MVKLKHSIGILLCICLMAFVSCNSKQVFHDEVKFPGNTWNKDSIVHFTVEIPDTLKSYNIVLTLTNTEEYPYSNLYLFGAITFPDTKVVRDTVEFMLAAPDGQWLGKNKGGYVNEFQYQTNIRFPHEGTYDFSFEQAMRCANPDCNVKGIRSVSFSLNTK